ncbi:aminoglycoside phosphotransferase family protein [Terasakiella sp. SH-1]|uniref:aminoglycoside phosphotransferase family protein n=1 Tax=Terasakiella sp. SH-1 TaxID=2560057 RepID=UPI001074830C|nr:aminoglycoside phosphotransferase family protein [Terasakiella sp. SH-1]
MSDILRNRCVELIEQLGIGNAQDVTEVTPLTGGVASDIARVTVGGRQLCIKFALAKLKVKEDWQAPVHRNAAEYAWLKVAAEMQPKGAVKLFGQSDELHGFAMEFVSGDGVYLWKEAMLEGDSAGEEAEMVGDALGHIHAASAQDGFDQSAFKNRDDFYDIRVEPYLVFTAGRHPEIADTLKEMAEGLYNSNQVLVHGDISPKNILLRTEGPVFLDAECATMGDASFDPAFCLNHLVIKALHLPAKRKQLLKSALTFWESYASHICWEDPAVLEARVCRLLAAFMLARVDGKSPVEYLNEDERTSLRGLALSLLKEPKQTLSDFINQLTLDLEGK